MSTAKASTTRKVLVTGGAGFIGSHLVDRLLCQGDTTVVLDNFNAFYPSQVKRRNIQEHLKHSRYMLVEGDLRNQHDLEKVFAHGPFDVVVHLAAMAGVRPSMQQPALYMDVNVTGTQNLIDNLLANGNQSRLVFGSSSSVYGERSGETFLETDLVDRPLSPYAASKAAGELLCYSAHHTRGLSVVCLRFFTVFGPRQRPDLAIHKFCQLIDQSKPIDVFGDGTSKRDYTFIDDIVSGIQQAMKYNLPGYDIINLGRSQPIVLMDMIHCLEQALGKQSKLVYKPFAVGDMPYTYASIEKAQKVLGYNPTISFETGVQQFVSWYLNEKACANVS
ncbi:MAG: SDR family NAD(P)-dependent oxidoreductase [Candidatus Melainabacteria bacterium]|nr:SDR family NAD(P)-dependent oxidoreductase [Candidatus Melainabacteria bacterium]